MNSSLQQQSYSRAGWIVLRLVLLVEAVLGLLLVISTFSAFLAASDDPLGARLSVLLAVVICWVWTLATLLGAWRGLGWARGSAITLHVLLFATATGVLQGIFGQLLLLGLTLLLLALLGFFAALLARPLPEERAS